MPHPRRHECKRSSLLQSASEILVFYYQQQQQQRVTTDLQSLATKYFLEYNNNKIIYSHKQQHIFALSVTSFGHYGHHQANILQKFKKGWLHIVRKMLRCMGSHLLYYLIFMVKPCTNNIQHFNIQLMHTTLNNVELLKHFKISKTAPTCFGLQENHHQGATPVLS